MATTTEPDQESGRATARRARLQAGTEPGLERLPNFAISFTIISVLAGCFTTYDQAWNNGGPIAISWGWPIISGFILIIAFCMSELVSAYPTAGGIYWWSAKLGGPVWGWFTGWFNLLGLIAIVASVDYFARPASWRVILGLYGVNIFGINFGDADASAPGDLPAVHPDPAAARVHQHLRQPPRRAVQQRLGVLARPGVAVIVAMLDLRARQARRASTTSSPTHLNNSGFSSSMFWWYVLPLGFLLTQYTITGYDASAHISEETHDAEMAAAGGVWQSVF